MRVTFDKDKLMTALMPAAGISQVKNTLATVEGLLFECPPREKYGAFDGNLATTCRISAFDLSKGMQTTVECSIEEEGIFCINTSKILQIVRVMPEGQLTIDIDDRNRVKVTGGQSSFEITAQNGMDFPTMPMFVGDRVYELPQHLLRDIIGQTVFAVGQNDPRPAFNGALFRIRDNVLTVVGCDGQRLAAASCPLGGEAPDAELVIPGKFLLELAKLLKDSEDTVTMIVGRKHVIFRLAGEAEDGTGSIWFFTRIIEAEFLKYEKVLPSTFRLQCYISLKELTGAVERASLVTEDKLGGNSKPHVKLSFEGASRSVAISSVSAGGSVFERVSCAMEGEDLAIGFNCRLLVDALRHIPEDTEMLRIRLHSPLMGIVIEPAGGTSFASAVPDPEVFGDRGLDVAPADKEDEKEYMYLVMPMRMNN